jgi:hypothetical protein
MVDSQTEVLIAGVQDLTSDELLDRIGKIESLFGLTIRGDKFAPTVNSFKIYFQPAELDGGVPRDEIDMKKVDEQQRRKLRILDEWFNHASVLSIIDEDTPDINGVELKVRHRINRLIKTVVDAYELVFSHNRMYANINYPTLDPSNFDTIYRCTTMDGNFDDISPYQQLILATLEQLGKFNVRRYKGYCCKQIKSPDGHLTKAWKAVMTIAEFVYTFAQKEHEYLAWRNLTSKGSCGRDVVKHLTDCKDIQFPEIIKNRHVWSFTNGIFVGKEWSEKTKRYTSNFYSYDSNECQKLDPMIVSSKYFELPFNPYRNFDDWWDIPTPYFQSIMDYQEFEPEVCKWMYVMGGKMCFDVGDIDGWQIIGFLKGVARSGKSTIITKIFKKFYESEDVRTLSNNVERKFGLSSIYDGLMFIAPEVKGDLALEQAEFQSLVSGEDISIARKNEKAISIEWKTPGILGGNEVPNWKDNSGSVLRRLLPWNFAKQVEKADPHLDTKLDQEIPAILLKCVRAYLDYAQKYSDQDIWNVVPKYFKTIQNQVAMVTNTLQNFLSSEKVRYGKDLCCPQKIFVQLFNQHCHENNLGRFKFNPDFYAAPFSSRKLEVKTASLTYNGRVYGLQPFVYGLDVVDENLNMSDDF